MSCNYCKLKMRPLQDGMKVLKGESWKDDYNEGGYIGQEYDDVFQMIVYYDCGYASTVVDNIKYCPFCGAELTMPKEPLIKDEKIRKAVRAWADASGIEKVVSYGDVFWLGFRSTNTGAVWKFECNYMEGSDFKHHEEYTIAELCGEEECES